MAKGEFEKVLRVYGDKRKGKGVFRFECEYFDEEIHEKVGDYLWDLVERLMENMDWEYELVIKAVADQEMPAYYDKTMFNIFYNKKYIIIMSIDILLKAVQGDDNLIWLNLARQFRFLKDKQFAYDSHGDIIKFNFQDCETVKEVLVYYGYKFWASFNANRMMYMSGGKEYIDAPDMVEVMDKFEEIYEFAVMIQHGEVDDEEKSFDMLTTEINTLILMTEQFCGAYAIEKQITDYDEEVKNRPEYLHICKIILGTSKIYDLINVNPFGDKFEENFSKLGNFIFEYFYDIYRVYLETNEKGEPLLVCRL